MDQARPALSDDGTADTSPVEPETRHVDVLVVGAGLSGIAAGYYLQKACPEKTYAVLEAREAIGGTWDLFRYPGLRSDSDLYTFGFSFRPWRSDTAIADGASILRYLRATAAEYGIDAKTRFGNRVVAAAWDSGAALWSVDVEVGAPGTHRRYTCTFLSVCAGYYDYEAGYSPGWPGMERFGGPVVHPQAWPEGLDTAGKRVVLIGSGATAVTMVPELAKTAAHVTMLQRSPSYIAALPARDASAAWLRRRLPDRLAHGVIRWKNVLLSILFYQIARRRPAYFTHKLLQGVRARLGPGFDVGTHFTPRYKPWDQRLCLSPDGDLFRAIRDGRARVETDTIAGFDETGLRLESGRHLPADIVVTATGLRLKLLGGIRVTIDGVPADLAERTLYKGTMFSGVPNLAVALGYTNASWTLKCELSAAYVCRLLRRMEARGEAWCMPEKTGAPGAEPAVDFTSGYILRARDSMPKQGARRPWRLHQNYLLDLVALRFGRIDDGVLRFGRRGASARAA